MKYIYPYRLCDDEGDEGVKMKPIQLFIISKSFKSRHECLEYPCVGCLTMSSVMHTTTTSPMSHITSTITLLEQVVYNQILVFHAAYQ